MPLMQTINRPGRRLVARHLSRLSNTLETFGTRLREAVSTAVGETVSGIVRETVRALLAALKHQRRRSQAVQQAMQSLKELHLDR